MNTETVARVVAALQKNDGILTVASAKKAGVGKVTLWRAAENGYLKRTGRDRYAAPEMPPRQVAWKGGYLGQEAILSVEGAGYYWAFDAIDEFTLAWSVPHGSRAAMPNLIQRRKYDHLEVVERDGVRVTSPAQTLLDIAARVDLDRLERMYESALRKGLVDDIEMRHWIEAHAGWHGAPALRAVMRRRRPGERPTGSDVETICLQIYRRAGIPAVRQYQVVDADGEHIAFGDFGFPPKACITEVDGLKGHDLERRQHDYDRQGRVEDQGFLVRRFTAEDVRYRGWYVCERTLRAIGRARPL